MYTCQQFKKNNPLLKAPFIGENIPLWYMREWLLKKEERNEFQVSRSLVRQTETIVSKFYTAYCTHVL